jgi:5'-AMP-activated protein kinase catalytic alpha subunit
VAIKILEKKKMTEQADVERVTREIHILQKIRHPNIIQLYDVRKFNIDCHLDYRDAQTAFPDYGICERRRAF